MNLPGAESRPWLDTILSGINADMLAIADRALAFRLRLDHLGRSRS